MNVYQINQKKGIFELLSVNMILIGINVLAFIVFSVLLLTGVIPIDYVAIKPSNILAGKYLWTLLTSMFMHGGFFHLFANMLSLIFVGSLMERILGRKRYFWFYILSGVFASLVFVALSFYFTSDINSYAVGASGALFGLIGVLVFITPNLPVYLFFIPIPVKMKYAAPGLLILLWFISVAPIAFGGQQIPIGNTAHFGGLLAGLAYGIYLRNKYPNKVKHISKLFS